MAQDEIHNQSDGNPLINPERDRLGYAPFAQYLADSICKMACPEGFAIAVYGSWGSGKSTLLNFVIHYLQQKPENERPIIVPFNPWLFSGNEDITRRFFDQLENVLSQQTSVPKGLRERIADIAKVISEIPLPYAQATKPVVRLFDEKEKETSEIKEEVEETLIQQTRRIVITVDDIDRLGSDDIRKLFRIFKAIPNFQNVVYLLVFDKEVAIKALAENEASLEKIIQFNFEVPIPDKISLRRLLFEKLDIVMADTPQELFDSIYWGNVYLQGIDKFINNLRDVVSLTNAITVIYPVVKGEVNPVDFIAIESMRLFCPIMYDIICKNYSLLIGEDSYSVEELKSILNSWLSQLSDEDKEPVKQILMQLFPKLELVWRHIYHDEQQQSLDYCKQLRICCPEIFPRYFRLTLSTGELSNHQIQSILALAGDTKAFGEKLLELANQKRPDGTTKVREFLERLEDDIANNIPQDNIPSIIQALLDVSDEILCPEDKPSGMFDLGNEIRIARIISRLLHRLDQPIRFEVMKKALAQNQRLSILVQKVAISSQ
ncbi:KAP family NTPase [Fischerella sp. PCC 9605]|uniref:KAP family NTPase n=1 Tax=Fischerella sp. PCC 9605 TaxID=1173024 RepID=UPI00047BE979|nr:P-loop NTPase fold protein [Fischerella sp. PCC 9605]